MPSVSSDWIRGGSVRYLIDHQLSFDAIYKFTRGVSKNVIRTKETIQVISRIHDYTAIVVMTVIVHIITNGCSDFVQVYPGAKSFDHVVCPRYVVDMLVFYVNDITSSSHS